MNQLAQWRHQACLVPGNRLKLAISMLLWKRDEIVWQADTYYILPLRIQSAAILLIASSLWTDPRAPIFPFLSISKSASFCSLSLSPLFPLPNSISSRHPPLSLSPWASLEPDTVSDDVSLASMLTLWGERYYFAPAVWVKSPLTEIREHCLLGPASLQLPHRHTWRAPLHSSARLCCHTFQNVLYGHGQLLRTVRGVSIWCWWYWTSSGETIKVKLSFGTVRRCDFLISVERNLTVMSVIYWF